MLANVTDITRNSYLRWLSTFCDWLVMKRKLPRNPVTVRIDHNAHSPRKPFCSKAQVAQLFEKAKDDKELTFILHCGFNAGFRFEEITQARPHWFDLENGLIHVQRSASWSPKDKVKGAGGLLRANNAVVRIYDEKGKRRARDCAASGCTEPVRGRDLAKINYMPPSG
jgi:integrase